ncbi:MAG: hypothetical protein ABI851_12600 [Saprospiraceae bacterium]
MSFRLLKYLFFIPFIFIGCFYSFMQSNVKNGFFFSSLAATLANSQNKYFDNNCNLGVNCIALMSSRFKNLDHLKSIVSISYDMDYSKMDSIDCLYSVVNLNYISNDEKINRRMTSGISQNDIIKLQKPDYLARLKFVLYHPTIMRLRKDLEQSYMLARRRPDLYGPIDVSFYDLAETSFRHINTPILAFRTPRDSSEKGFINTFNHVTAQAIISSFFSEELGDLIGDLHERNNMPEITSGRFSQSQLNDSLNNPEDNYIDIINNEIGQKIGLKLKKKYNLNEKSLCTPILLAAFLNDIQSYYMWAFEMGMDYYRPTDELVVKFSKKMNKLLIGS